MGLGTALLLAAALVPRPAAPLEWKTADGQTLALQAHRGKAVVVQFFSPG